MAYTNNEDYKKYLSNQIQTANSGQLVVLLYEGAIKVINIAIDNMNYKTYDKVNEHIIKAINILDELQKSLDMKAGEIAARLDSIYEYLLRELKKANIEKDSKILEQVKKILLDLLASWKTVAKQPDQKQIKTNKKNYSSGFEILG